MAIKNKFIHFNTEAGFKNYLLTGNGSGGGFLNTEGTNFEENIYSVKPEKQEDWNLFKNYTCFIKDTQRIWTHEKFYNCDTSNYFNINRGEITDANNINNIGMYTFTSDTQNIPSEMSGSGIILTYASTVSPDNFIQMCTGFRNGTPASWYIRSKIGTNNWSNWSKLLDDRNLTKLSQLEDDIVNGKYLPITGGDVSGDINLTASTARIRVSGTDLLSYVTSDGSTRLARNTSGPVYIGNIDGEIILYGSNLTFYNGKTCNIYHSGNLNPVTLDTDQIITGWKRFNPSTKNGVFNTTGIIDNKDTYATPLSWTAKSAGSIWNLQQESDGITLIGIQGGKAIKLLSNSSQSQVIADIFVGTVTQIRDSSNNSSKKIWTGTQSEYNAISSKDANTIYLITE